jgi:hypothetical protein
MPLRGIKQLAGLNERLGIPESRPDSHLSLKGEPVQHYRWPCGCSAVTMSTGLVAWDACEKHGMMPTEDCP